MSTKTEATIEDLYKVDGKAEIVNGEVVPMSPTGQSPHHAARAIFLSLYEYERRTGRGYATTDNAGFAVNLPRRKSFSPDAAFYLGSVGGMRFFDGPPAFAVEVRSENDYGAKAERPVAEKRADYFAAGTRVVWDVDLLGEDVVRVYRADDPQRVKVYRRGEVAEAEPAVPGWTMPVDDLFVE
jgi:Uma2 family endonuclease